MDIELSSSQLIMKVDHSCGGFDSHTGPFWESFLCSASTMLQSPPTVRASQVKGGKMKISAGVPALNVNYSSPM